MILQKNAAVTVDVFPQAFRRLIRDLGAVFKRTCDFQIPNQLLATERLNGAHSARLESQNFVGTLTAERTDPDPRSLADSRRYVTAIVRPTSSRCHHPADPNFRVQVIVTS